MYCLTGKILLSLSDRHCGCTERLVADWSIDSQWNPQLSLFHITGIICSTVLQISMIGSLGVI